MLIPIESRGNYAHAHCKSLPGSLRAWVRGYRYTCTHIQAWTHTHMQTHAHTCIYKHMHINTMGTGEQGYGLGLLVQRASGQMHDRSRNSSIRLDPDKTHSHTRPITSIQEPLQAYKNHYKPIRDTQLLHQAHYQHNRPTTSTSDQTHIIHTRPNTSTTGPLKAHLDTQHSY